jgi:hypothetical protein
MEVPSRTMAVRTGPPRPRRPTFSELVQPTNPAPLAARLTVARAAAEAEAEKLKIDAGVPAVASGRHGLPLRALVGPFPLAVDVAITAAVCMQKLR